MRDGGRGHEGWRTGETLRDEKNEVRNGGRMHGCPLRFMKRESCLEMKTSSR